MTRGGFAARVGCAVALAGVAGAAAALTPAEVYALASPSVWRVVTYDVDGLQLGQGSAVVVGAETLATNCHVLAKAKRVVVRHDKASFDARLDLWDAPRDVCQLRAAGLAAPPVRILPTASVVVGTNVYAIGTPRGLELTMSAGLVSSLRRNAAGQVILVQTSASISRGSSGGGLFDDTGALVGLTTIGSVTGDAQNLNFAIPADWIVELPERHARARGKAASSPGRADDAAASTPTQRR